MLVRHDCMMMWAADEEIPWLGKCSLIKGKGATTSVWIGGGQLWGPEEVSVCSFCWVLLEVPLSTSS